jgi:hypothetical protein
MDIDHNHLQTPALIAPQPARRAPFVNRAFAQSAPGEKIPDGWDPIRVKVDGTPISCFYSRADGKPQAMVIALSGLQSSPLAKTHEFERLRSQGVSILSMALHPEPNHQAYAQINTRIIHKLVFNRDSIFHSIGDPSLPRTLMTHSTSGGITQELLSHEAVLEEAQALFDGAIHLNPFFDTGRSSERHFPRLSKLYEIYAKRHEADPVLGSLLERLIVGESDNEFYQGAPKHGLILALRRYAREFQHTLFEGNTPPAYTESLQAFPQRFILGSKDHNVCNMTAQDIADRLGIDAKTYPIGHGDALKNDESFASIVSFVKNPQATPRPTPATRKGAEVTNQDLFTSMMVSM